MAKHVYIHIPFCSYICSYCDFVKMVKIDKYFDKYLTSLKAEVTSRYNKEEISTVYIGGGTPSVLTSTEILDLGKLISGFNLANEVEITFEANPDTLTFDKLHALKRIGVNRLSIGVQTFNEAALKSFNRQHSNQMVFDLIRQAKMIGFHNINVDLIYGYRNQSFEDLKQDLETFLSLNIEHISIYSLQVEDNSVFGKYNYQKIDDELEADYYIHIKDFLSQKGFNHYEISNFSKEGFQSKHNNCYWELKDYYGFGLGAHSLVDGERLTNTSSMEDYISGKIIVEQTQLTIENQIEEYVFLGLRKLDGISKKEFLHKFKKPIEFYFDNVIILLENKGLITVGDNIKLTSEGLLLANEVMCQFLID